MYSYRHHFHAGNFADVHKHLALLYLVSYLKQKPTPFAVLDAFAGQGLYDLEAKEALHNREFDFGFAKIETSSDTLVQDYLRIVQQCNTHGQRRFYPGSPWILKRAIRDNDRLILVEGHPNEIILLKQHFRHEKGVAIHHRDSFEATQALIPFPEKRGLIFLDPAYEMKSDYERIAQLVNTVLGKFRQAMILLWYPVLPERRHVPLLEMLRAINLNSLTFEWQPYPTPPVGQMIASGLLVFNPPWQIDTLKHTFEALNQQIYLTGTLQWQYLENITGHKKGL